MADMTRIELSIYGEPNAVHHFLAEELDREHHTLIDEGIRFTIEYFELQKEVDGDGNLNIEIRGEQAWDEGEMWVRSMRNDHPELTFEGLVQTWDVF